MTTEGTLIKSALLAGVALAVAYVAASVISPEADTTKRPVGLKNDNRNACYANSVIQALAALSSVSYFLAQSQSLPLCGALDKTLSTLRRSQVGRQTTSNVPIIQAMQLVLQVRISPAQQDCHEFLVLLLDAIEREAPRIKDYVQGRIQDNSTCLICRKNSISEQVFNALSLYLPNVNEISAHELIDSHFKEEVIPDVDCEQCSADMPKPVKSFHLIKHTPVTLPRVLILHINRATDYITRKTNRANVTFTESLTVGTTYYSLCAIIAHTGKSSDSGHYVCYRRQGGRWWQFSDSKVVKISFDDVAANTSKVYLMWYDAA